MRAKSGPKTDAGKRGGGRGNAAAAKRKNADSGMGSQVFGALDLGTNNCRLLVAKPAQQGYRVVDTFSRVVRLGEGLSQSDTLSDLAMDRTLRALKICSSKMLRLGVTQARCVATEACRRASNYPAFRDRVESEFGLSLELISSREETRLAVYGCAPLFDPEVETALVFDIGGGSTEVCWVALPEHTGAGDSLGAGDGISRMNGAHATSRSVEALANCLPKPVVASAQPEVLAWKSLPMGVTNLAERYGGGDISQQTYAHMVSDVLAILEPFEREHGIMRSVTGRRVQMLGTSGTVTTLVGIKKDLARYDRRRVDGSYLSRDSVEVLNKRVAGMTYKERVAHPCIGHQRADLVVAGCAILDALCRTWPVERLRVADRGLREGIIFTLMQGL